MFLGSVVAHYLKNQLDEELQSIFKKFIKKSLSKVKNIFSKNLDTLSNENVTKSEIKNSEMKELHSIEVKN